jgi:cell division septation protein DedD
MNAANIRNLEQIQEAEPPRGLSVGSLLLSALACGALVVAAVFGYERSTASKPVTTDPLQQLLASAAKPASAAGVVAKDQVTFPALLSDGRSPTTALAAVRDEAGKLVAAATEGSPGKLEASKETSETLMRVSSNDSLRRAPQPVGDLLSGTRVTQEPKDELSQLARKQGLTNPATEMAAPGEPGGIEIQVASFQNEKDADELVVELRKRGHRAFKQSAYVQDRGLWYRVRIGPFKSEHEAKLYQSSFEKAERVSTFLIDPEKLKRQEEVRAAKLKAREDRDARRKKRAQAKSNIPGTAQ